MPIWETEGDRAREQGVADIIQQQWPRIQMMPCPRYYPTDFHMLWTREGGRANYMGDLEVKVFTHDSSRDAIFNFNKLSQIMVMPPYLDYERCQHRVAFKFTDGISVIPVRRLATVMPVVLTRRDTGETDLVVKVQARDLGAWIDGSTPGPNITVQAP